MGEGEERVRDRDGSAGYDGVDYLSSIGTAWQGNWPTVIGFCAHAGLRVPSFGVDTSQTKTIDRFTRLVSSCGDVVDSVFEFDADGSCHAGILCRDGKCVTSRELTPYPCPPYPRTKTIDRFNRLVSSCGDVVDSVFEFDADGCCHAEILRRDGKCVTSQELTPYRPRIPRIPCSSISSRRS